VPRSISIDCDDITHSYHLFDDYLHRRHVRRGDLVMDATLRLPASHSHLAATGIARAVHRVLATRARWSPTMTRVAFGTTMAAHGAQKLLGWFGGSGYDGTMSFFVDTIGMPAPLGTLVILLESFGALAVVAGLATRPIALGLAAVMLGAVLTVHLPAGFFFMDWFGQQHAEGIEFFVLAIAMCGSLMIDGGGRWSLDRVLVTSLRW
jgi:putative oxidoreductase